MIDVNNGKELREGERQVLLQEGRASRIAALEAQLENPIEWYQQRFYGSLWRFILSHPDADHMAGLRCILDEDAFDAVNFWDLTHTKPLGNQEDYTTNKAYLDRALYECMRKDEAIESLVWPKVLEPERADSRQFWDADGIEILSPSHTEVEHWDARSDWNNMSFVLRINFGARSLLLPGDIEQAGWDAVAASCDEIYADVLLASHHGRKNGYPDNGVLKMISPSAVILSSNRLPAEHCRAQATWQWAR